jgi:hypothetical protein
MKWRHRTAQGFSPGCATCKKSPCKGGRFDRCEFADMAVELIRALWVNRFIEVPKYGFGRPCRAILSGAFPRVEALGYFVEPFHGGSLPFSLFTGGFQRS